MRRAYAALFVTLALQAFLVVRTPTTPLNGDEPYYVGKATHLRTFGHIEQRSPAATAVERGAWGHGDWRQPGYPVFLSLLIDGSDSALRQRVALVQFLMVSIAAVLAFIVIAPMTRYKVGAAIFLAACPWPFEYVTSIVPDQLSAFLGFLGLLVLWRADGQSRPQLYAVGGTLLGLTFLVRPEMVALYPFIIALALLVDRQISRRAIAHALLGLALPLLLHYGYRIYFTGEPAPRFLPRLATPDRNAMNWASTWLGSEKEKYYYVYAMASGQPVPPPQGSYSDEFERNSLVHAARLVRSAGSYTPEVDHIFATLTAKRRSDRPLFVAVVPRVWHSAHLWINTETNAQLLHFLSGVDRRWRRLFLGTLLVGKLLLLLVLFPLAIRRGLLNHSRFIMIFATFVLARTALIGVVLNSAEHRYVLVAWIPLLACCASFLAVRKVSQTLPPAA